MKLNSSKFPAGLLTLVLGCVVLTWMVERRGEKSLTTDPHHSSGQHLSVQGSLERNGKLSQRSTGDPRRDGEIQNELQRIEDLARNNHDAAISLLDSFSDPELRALALAAIARGWAKSDPKAAGAWVAKLEPEIDSTSAALGLIPAWVAESPDDCLKWATDLTSANLRELSLAQLADAWVSKDPQRAVACYFALKPEPGSETGLHVIVSQWALDAPEVAVNYFTQTADLARREEFLETALVSLTNKNPAFVWSHAAAGFSDSVRILNVRAMALEAISETNPNEAIQLAESVGNDPELLMGIARGWSLKDEAAAKEWISRITDPELTKLLMRQISPP